MNRNLDQAIENKEVHMNCCQSVFCSQCEKFGISKSVAYHLGAFFNAGMRHGEVCGACSGALMVLGMKYGDADNQKCKESLKFLKAFEEHFGVDIPAEDLEQLKTVGDVMSYVESHKA